MSVDPYYFPGDYRPEAYFIFYNGDEEPSTNDPAMQSFIGNKDTDKIQFVKQSALEEIEKKLGKNLAYHDKDFKEVKDRPKDELLIGIPAKDKRIHIVARSALRAEEPLGNFEHQIN